ncbi:MAG: pyridoxal phosphate-dependent aminotransferase, partial [Bacteroidales bacterium]
YGLSAGVSHSAQFGLTAMLKAQNDGTFNYRNDVKEYSEKAKIMKGLFIKYGFKIPYDSDNDKPIADGFYFTVSYPGFKDRELLWELLRYGVSAISLDITGSDRKDGLRACVSLVPRELFGDLDVRLKKFSEDHSIEKHK